MTRQLAKMLTLPRIGEMQQDSAFIFTEIAIDLGWFRRGYTTASDADQEPRQRPGGLEVHALLDTATKKPVGHSIHVWLGEERLSFSILQPGQADVQFISHNVRTSFRVTLAAALMSAGVPAVRLCPVCDRIFVGSGKRQFCTLRCKSTEMMRRFRERKLEEIRKQARETYERRVRKKLRMKNVKISSYQKRKTQPKEVS